MGTGEFNAGGNPAMDWHPIQGGVEILPVASCYRNRDNLRPDWPLGLNADFTLTSLLHNSDKNHGNIFSKVKMASSLKLPTQLLPELYST